MALLIQAVAVALSLVVVGRAPRVSSPIRRRVSVRRARLRRCLATKAMGASTVQRASNQVETVPLARRVRLDATVTRRVYAQRAQHRRYRPGHTTSANSARRASSAAAVSPAKIARSDNSASWRASAIDAERDSLPHRKGPLFVERVPSAKFRMIGRATVPSAQDTK